MRAGTAACPFYRGGCQEKVVPLVVVAASRYRFLASLVTSPPTRGDNAFVLCLFSLPSHFLLFQSFFPRDQKALDTLLFVPRMGLSLCLAMRRRANLQEVPRGRRGELCLSLKPSCLGKDALPARRDLPSFSFPGASQRCLSACLGRIALLSSILPT